MRRIFLYLIGFCLIVFVTYTIFVTNTAVQSDEWTYMKNAYLIDLKDNEFGNYAHSWLYSITEKCGPYWYNCVKAVNWIFVLAFAAALAYMARLYNKKWQTTAFVFVIGFTGPATAYSPYFMPESMAIAFTVWTLAICIALVKTQGRKTTYAILGGLSLAIALLSKPHALAMFAAIGLFSVFTIWNKENKQLKYNLWSLLAVAILTRSALGYLSGGLKALNPFGGYFSPFPVAASQINATQATSEPSIASQQDLLSALLAIITNVTPFMAIAAATLLFIRRKNLINVRNFSTILTSPIGLVFTATLTYVVMAAAFAARLELAGSEETQLRTLGRYWEFMLLLLPMSAIMLEQKKTEGSEFITNGRRVWPLIALLLPATIFVMYLAQRQALSDTQLFYYYGLPFLGLILAITVAAYLPSKNIPSNNLFLGVTGTMLLVIGLSSWTYTLQEKSQDISGRLAGQWMYSNIERPNGQPEGVVMIGSRISSFVTAFYAQQEEVTYVPVASYSPIDETKIPDGTKWVLATEETYFNGDYLNTFSLGNVTFYQLAEQNIKTPQAHFPKWLNISPKPNVTFWGGWVPGKAIKLSLSETTPKGEILIISLVANDELQSRKVRVTTSDGKIEGELEPDQTMTQIKLTKKNGTWANEVILIESLDQEFNVRESTKHSAIGLELVQIKE